MKLLLPVPPKGTWSAEAWAGPAPQAVTDQHDGDCASKSQDVQQKARDVGGKTPDGPGVRSSSL